MKLTATQLRNIIKTEVKRLGGKAINEAPRRAGGRAPMPKFVPIRDPEMASFDGTVGGLILALKKMPADMTVMFGEDGAFDTASLLEIIYFDDDMMQVEEEGGGTPHVVIMS